MGRWLCVYAVLSAVLGGCGAIGGDDGNKIGGGTDDYRKSPCACVEQPMRFKRQFVG